MARGHTGAGPSRAALRDDCPRVILGNPLSPTEHVRGAQPSQQDRAKGVRGLRNAEPGPQVGRGSAETRSRLRTRTRDGGGGRSGRGRGRVSSPVSARPAWHRGVSGGAATRAEPTRAPPRTRHSGDDRPTAGQNSSCLPAPSPSFFLRRNCHPQEFGVEDRSAKVNSTEELHGARRGPAGGFIEPAGV